MSQWLAVTITTGQRVSLGQGGARAFLTRSFPAIPGSVWRGALAAAWLAYGSPQGDGFRDLFERSRFSLLLPQGVDVEPQSVKTCKYHRDAAHTEPGLSVGRYHDEAFEGRLPAATQGCSGLERLKGGFTPFWRVAVTTTALNPREHTAKDAQLFSRETLAKGTIFTGFLVVPAGVDWTPLERLTEIYVGGRSSIMGRSTLSLTPCEGPPGMPLRRGQYVLRTMTPAILVDEAGCPSQDIVAELAHSGIRVSLGSTHSAEPKPEVWAGRVDTSSAGGWHNASNLPKPTEASIAPGATVKVDVDDLAALRRLLDRGIGLRRAEGFGWITIAASAWVPQTPLPSWRIGPATPQTPLSNATNWFAEVEKLKLADVQMRWLADQMRLHDAGHTLTEQEREEPALRRATTCQREGILRIVLEVPSDQRNSLAHAITRGERS